MLMRLDKLTSFVFRSLMASLIGTLLVQSAFGQFGGDVNEIDPFGDDSPATPVDPADPTSQQPGSTEGPSAQEVFDEGKKLAEEGKCAEAVELFSQVLAAAPSFAPASLERGKCLAELGELQLAMRSFGDAVNYGQRYPGVYSEALAERGKLNLDLGTYQEAIDDFELAVQSNPSNPEYQYLRGKALIRNARTQNAAYSPGGAAQFYVQAISSLDRAIELNPNYADAYAERGEANVSTFEFDKAISDFEQAVALDDANTNSKAQLGFALVRRADYEKRKPNADMDGVAQGYQSAIDSYAAYLAIEGSKAPEEFEDADPEFIKPEQVYLGRASAYLSLANEKPADKSSLYELAIDDTDKAFEYDDRLWTALYQKGVALRLMGRLEDAADSFTDSLQLNPANSEGFVRRGIVYYYLGELEAARGDLYQALELTEQPDGRAHFWLGVIAAKEGNMSEAIRLYSKCIRVNPSYKPAYNNRGLIYLQQGEYRRAEKDFDELIRRDRNDSVARERRDRARQMAANNP